MDIYDFFNSRDIAEHCRKIGQKFTAKETAYLVWHSNHHALAAKHAAWNEIIDTMPDEPLKPKWIDEEACTLHEFLRTYMRLQNEFVEEFLAAKDGYIYTYEIMHKHDDEFRSDDIFFDSYEACLNALKRNELDDDEYNEIAKAKIIRHRLYSSYVSFCDAQEEESIVFDKQLNILNIEPASDQEGEKKLLGSAYGFYEMWIVVPTPFRKGDIVTDVDVYEGYPRKHRPFILDHIPYWRRDAEDGTDCEEQVQRLLALGVDWTDMQEGVYFQDDNGEIYWDHAFHYLDLEYYRDELVGTEKFLLAVSRAIQGKIGIEELLRSRNIILMEHYASEDRVYFGDNRELLQLCGIEKESEQT